MRNKIIENDKFVWYSSEETALSAEYLKMKGLDDHYVAIAVSKLDDREEYVLLRADSTGATSAVFAASIMSEVVEYIDTLSKTLNA
jgi:hypothetical protein